MNKCLCVVLLCLLAVSCFDVNAFGLSFGVKSGISRTRVMLVKKDINMPALSSTMKEGKVVAWNKNVGDKVSAGDVLLVVESDKADMDVEAFEDGFLAAIYTPAGSTAAVGAAVAVLVDSKEDVNKVGTASSSSKSVSVSEPVSHSPPAVPSSDSLPVVDFHQIMMPALSSTMKEGKVVSWSKKVGDKVSPGDMVLVVESDKADMDVEAYEEGYLAVIVVGDGQVAPVGSPVGYLAKTKDEIQSVQGFVSGGGKNLVASSETPSSAQPLSSSFPIASTPSSTANTAIPQQVQAIVNEGRIAASGFAKQVAKDQGIDLRTVTPSRPDQYITAADLKNIAKTVMPTQHIPASGSINASPMARKLAAENHIDIASVKGSGNFGRVMPDDVLRAAGKLPPLKGISLQQPTAVKASPKPMEAKQEVTSTVSDGKVAMTGMQKAVAKNMEKSLSAPVFRVSRDIVTDRFDELYAKLKPKGVTVSAMLAKAVAEACKKHPIMNAAYCDDGSILYHKDVNVAMAVAIDGGLITPTIMKTNELDLFSVSRTWKELVEKAKQKKLSPAEYTSGTITISNLGMFGVSSFDAILPPGMGAIIAISASLPRVTQLSPGQFGVQKVMTVTVTSDHRHIYGAHVAEFLRDLADLLENNVQELTMG